MTYKVIKRFRDKYTRGIYSPGDLFECEDTARTNDLTERKLIQDMSTINYEDMNKKDLMTLLDEKGIEYSAKARKDELISLLEGD